MRARNVTTITEWHSSYAADLAAMTTTIATDADTATNVGVRNSWKYRASEYVLP